MAVAVGPPRAARARPLALPRVLTGELARAGALAVATFAVSRGALLGEAALLAHRHGTGLTTVLRSWDAAFYAGIAGAGYPVSVHAANGATLAFFPLYPLLGGVLARLGGVDPVWGSMAAGWLAGAALAVLVTALVAERRGAVAGRRAGVLVSLFPGAFVSGLTYGDGLAACLALAALAAAGRRRFGAAAVAAAGACATSPIVVVPLVAATAVVALRERRWPALRAPLGALSGAAAVVAGTWLRTGSPLTWWRVERADWDVRTALPWSAHADLSVFGLHTAGSTAFVAVSAALSIAGLGLLALRRWPLEWFVYSLALLLMVSLDSSSWIGVRFVFDAIPVVVALSAECRHRAVFWPVACCSAVALALTFAAYAPPNHYFFNP